MDIPTPPPTLRREQVRELDRRAIEEYGIDSIVLMENAGRACADEALRMLGEAPEGPALVLCGPGNNGGDGLVIARTLRNRGREVEVVTTGPLGAFEKGSADLRKNLELWLGLGGHLIEVDDVESVDRMGARFASSPLVVDAMFGTGLSRPLRAPWIDLVELLNASPCPVLAVDVPSGLDADSGEVLGAAVRADVTMTFVAAQPGFYRGAGPASCGRIEVAEIGIPAGLIEDALFEGR